MGSLSGSCSAARLRRDLPLPSSAALNGEQAPLARNALELRCAPVAEGDSGACDEVPDRARDDHLAGAGLRCDPRADVDRDPADLGVHALALAGVQPGPHLDAEIADALGDRTRAADPAGGPVERGEEAVAGGVELRAAVAPQHPAHRRVVILEQLAPARVSEFYRLGCRANDVGEQNRREHAVDFRFSGRVLRPGFLQELLERAGGGLPVAGGDRVVDPGQLDLPRAWDVLREIARRLTDELGFSF